MNYKLLIVDDEPANIRLLERLFRRDYQVITASSAVEALEFLAQHDIAVIISDQRMPQMTGIEFLKRAAEMRPHTVRIILTGYTDVNALVEVINSGIIYKYVSKPWVNEDLQQTVARALEHYETNKRQHELSLHNERLFTRLKATRRAVVELIAGTVGLNAGGGRGHAGRVGGFAAIIGHRLELDAEEIEQLSLAAHLHEAGHGKRTGENQELTGGEKAAAQRGSELTAQMLESVPDMDEIAAAVRCCHEQFDGGGFPRGLSDEQIPLFSRILAVACAYDAMTYPPEEEKFARPASRAEGVGRLQSEAGKQFDPRVVRAFCEISSHSQTNLVAAAVAYSEQIRQK